MMRMSSIAKNIVFSRRLIMNALSDVPSLMVFVLTANILVRGASTLKH